MADKTLDGKSFILRIEMDTDQIQFGQVAAVISDNGGDVIAIDIIRTNQQITTRDLTITVKEISQIEPLAAKIGALPGIRIINVSDRTFLLHLGGKIEMKPKAPIQNREDLSRVYTPDVARVCTAIREDLSKAFTLTIKKNTVAVVSDGSAVLGLGNIGAHAAMPVMEGKAMLFKQLADVDAFPICLNTQNTEQIIEVIKAISPSFGGINLEDISSPRCFEIEKRLSQELDIPVFHDDQHGTAVVMYAALLNALKLTGKSLHSIRVVVCGIGAAGIACTRILLSAGVKNIVGVDREGAITSKRRYENPMWNWFAAHTNPDQVSGPLSEVIAGADVFIGVSAGGVLTREDVLKMNENPIVFAMANPTPEIEPEAIEDIAAVVATGRSDYPNQINNVLCFPGIFRAALDCRAKEINEEMKLAAAEAIASVISDTELNKENIIPGVFNHKVVDAIRDKVVQAAIRTGAARRIPREYEKVEQPKHQLYDMSIQ